MIDLLVILLILATIYSGIKRGLVLNLLDIGALLLALAIGSLGFPVVGVVLQAIGFPPTVANLIGFILLALLIVIGGSYLASRTFGKLSIPKLLNRIGGALVGAFLGFILVGLLLLMGSAVPGVGKAVDHSSFGAPLVNLVPPMYQKLEAIGVDPPKLMLFPQVYEDELASGSPPKPTLQFRRLNFTKLDGSTCIACDDKVKFLGYKRRGGCLLIPKFECVHCGRTSDGCQTFEGFHKIYGKCPISLAEKGLQFNCGTWPNPEFVDVKGTCPVCGQKAD